MYSTVSICSLERAYVYEKNTSYVFNGHRHPSVELNYVLRGTMQVTYENWVIDLVPGDLLLIRPQSFHRNHMTSADGTTFAVFQFFQNDLPAAQNAAVPELLHCDPNEQALCALLLEELQQHTCSPVRDYENGIRLLEILLHRLFSRPAAAPTTVSAETLVYRQAVAYMQQHVCDGLQITDIARACHVSPTVLKRIFNRFTGGGAAHYYLELKMAYARDALRRGIPSCEIADALGFSSAAYFSQCFHRCCGCTPGSYKQQANSSKQQADTR